MSLDIFQNFLSINYTLPKTIISASENRLCKSPRKESLHLNQPSVFSVIRIVIMVSLP